MLLFSSFRTDRAVKYTRVNAHITYVVTCLIIDVIRSRSKGCLCRRPIDIYGSVRSQYIHLCASVPRSRRNDSAAESLKSTTSRGGARRRHRRRRDRRSVKRFRRDGGPDPCGLSKRSAFGPLSTRRL